MTLAQFIKQLEKLGQKKVFYLSHNEMIRKVDTDDGESFSYDLCPIEAVANKTDVWVAAKKLRLSKPVAWQIINASDNNGKAKRRLRLKLLKAVGL